MGEGEGVSYLDLSPAGTPVLLGRVGTTTCFGSPPCPYLAPDWATDVKEPGWFRNKNSRGLAESSFWAPERLAPDPAVWCSVLAGGAGFSAWPPRSVAGSTAWPLATRGARNQTGRMRGFLPEKLGLPLENLGLGLGHDQEQVTETSCASIPLLPSGANGSGLSALSRTRAELGQNHARYVSLCMRAHYIP